MILRSARCGLPAISQHGVRGRTERRQGVRPFPQVRLDGRPDARRISTPASPRSPASWPRPRVHSSPNREPRRAGLRHESGRARASSEFIAGECAAGSGATWERFTPSRRAGDGRSHGVGTLEASYAERLISGDRFVLDGRVFRFRRLEIRLFTPGPRTASRTCRGGPAIANRCRSSWHKSWPFFARRPARRLIEEGPAAVSARGSWPRTTSTVVPPLSCSSFLKHRRNGAKCPTLRDSWSKNHPPPDGNGLSTPFTPRCTARPVKRWAELSPPDWAAVSGETWGYTSLTWAGRFEFEGIVRPPVSTRRDRAASGCRRVRRSTCSKVWIEASCRRVGFSKSPRPV